MADDAPLSTTVPETVTIETGADPESVGSLNKAFDDFWSEQDTGTPSEKPAPKEEPPAAPAAPAIEPVKEPAPVVAPAVDIDKLELTGDDGMQPRPEHQEQFKKIKELWKGDQRRVDESVKRIRELENDLVQARQRSMTPEMQADYEHAAQIRRRFDFMSDPEFLGRFQGPVRNQFQKILAETVDYLPNRQEAVNWANHIAQNYGPDAVNRDWWMNSVVAKVPDELNRTALINSVSKLMELQRDRDNEITRRTQDRSSFDNWNTERTQLIAQRVQNELMDEIGKEEKRIQEFLPVDVSVAKTPDERRAMEEHNERFNKLNNFFVSQVKDISQNGPRAWVRVAIEATRSQIMNDQIINLERELASTKKERDKYRADLEKITGARRRLSQSTGSQPSAEPKRNGQGLSIKDLGDPRKTMNAFFDELDRNT